MITCAFAGSSDAFRAKIQNLEIYKKIITEQSELITKEFLFTKLQGKFLYCFA